ncbi:MAG: leucine-rich repeat domain-containing protein, partial [Oscillospiraceae bacterium]|nr:leucine-rich repeat domain-containing protein [Oscillospiraceae bacterium]
GGSVKGGAARINGKYDSSGSVTIETIPAADLQVYPGATQVNVNLPDSSGIDHAATIQISVDGKHFINYSTIDGLTPDTDYTLYYRQGPEGRIYVKYFHTATEEYGVTIGHQPVTDQNLGVLERDHWHYDPATATLTLQDLNLVDTGTDVAQALLAGVIVARNDITVELLGDNYVEYPDSRALQVGLFLGIKDLTITGPGNLTMKGSLLSGISNNGYGLYSNGGDIYLNGSGKLTFIETCSGVYAPTNHKVYYSNGNIDFRAGSGRNANDLIGNSYIDRFSFDNLLTAGSHSLTIKNGSGTTVPVSDFADYIGTSGHNKNLTFTMAHSYTAKKSTLPYLASGDCVSGAQYYYSCACGARGTSKYSVSAGSHSLVSHAAHPYDCAHPGWDAYQTCTKCGYSTFESHFHEANGHTWVEYDAVEPTCTADGCPDYAVCSVCGASTLPAVLPDRYCALGHLVVPVEVTPATCTQDGVMAHYACSRCGALFADAAGNIPTTAAALAQSAHGHSWGEPEIIGTESGGAIVRTCIDCGAVDTQPIGDAQPCGETAYWRVEGDTLTVFGFGAMQSYGGLTAPWAAQAADIKVLRVEEGVTVIGNSAFLNMSGLEEVYIPASVTTVDVSAFRGCAALRKVEFEGGPDDLAIQTYAFMNCTALEEIVLPANLTTLNNHVFRGCTALRKVTFLGGAPAGMSSSTFYNVTADVLYPQGESSWTASVRQNYGGTLTWIGYLGMGYCGYEDDTHAPEDVTWFLDENGVMTISGTGAMKNCSSNDGGKPWADYLTQITALRVEEGVTNIGSFAFSGAANLQEITFAQTVVSINSAAFYGCTSLTSVTFPHRISGISSYAFRNCT